MARAVRQLLPASFYKRDARVVARELVGCVLVHGPVALRITEVEAYPAGDTASHCRAGKTARNAPMWGPPGRAYMYLCYGIHQMLNIVTDVEGVGSAVLVRAAEIVAGEAEVVARRGWTKAVGPALLAGPGRVAQALALDASFNHHALFERGGLELHMGDEPQLAVGPRVGIDFAQPEDRDAPWRIADADSRWVSERKTLQRLIDHERP